MVLANILICYVPIGGLLDGEALDQSQYLSIALKFKR